MLTNIKVDGYRSLLDFEIELSSGLNIIVGTNGTGKSNFISFLDFLGEFLENGLNSGISIAQGAGSVFSKERFELGLARLEFSISGKILKNDNLEPYYMSDEEEYNTILYQYSCSITYIQSLPDVFIDSESLTLKVDNNNEITFHRKTILNDKEFKTAVTITPEDHVMGVNIGKWRRRGQKGEQQISSAEYLSEVMAPSGTIIRIIMGDVEFISTIMIDMCRYRSVNIDPSAARKPSPVGSSTQIQPSGEGLAGALYQLSRGSYFPGDSLRFSRLHVEPESQIQRYKNIISWCREVNSDIEGIEVQLDFHEAQFRPSVIFNFNNINETFSFNRISDGTVKWLALTTMLFVGDALSIIEEPENFLHPFMQEAFVALCREVIKSDQARVILISTHSPSLLDCCSPRELIMFSLVDGKTRASAVSNREKLAEMIAKSRFGLGYYYKTGGIYGEDSGIS
jgi:predicted ATPase